MNYAEDVEEEWRGEGCRRRRGTGARGHCWWYNLLKVRLRLMLRPGVLIYVRVISLASAGAVRIQCFEATNQIGISAARDQKILRGRKP